MVCWLVPQKINTKCVCLLNQETLNWDCIVHKVVNFVNIVEIGYLDKTVKVEKVLQFYKK
jgi:hypothetical protein